MLCYFDGLTTKAFETSDFYTGLVIIGSSLTVPIYYLCLGYVDSPIGFLYDDNWVT